MTGFTVVTGIDMAGILASGSGAIMTVATGAIYLSMVNPGHRRPCSGCVARFTGISGVDVGTVFTGGGTAVVAG